MPRKRLKAARKALRPYLSTRGQVSIWLALTLFAFLSLAPLVGGGQFIAGESPPYLSSDPTALSAEDRGRYSQIERAQQARDFGKADALIAELQNPGLVGYVLADRYLSGAYAASARELEAWLKHYSDQPQAPRVARIAALRGVKVTLPKPVEPLRGAGSGNNLGRSGMPDSWYSAMNHWREGEISTAAAIFEKLSKNESLNDWQRSAAHYWAHRAAERMDNGHEARAHLKAAAATPATFYGLLATETLGKALPVAEAPEVSNSLRHNPRAIRASLLAQLGRTDEAETELRTLYGALSESKRPQLVTLVSELNLPNLQLRLVRTPGLSKAEALFAQYPMPQYMHALDHIVDSALLMAVARNESAFHEGALNPISGAAGMMQMLPSTARAVERRVGETLLREASAIHSASDLSARLNHPAISARYGAEYLRMIAKEPAIENNLVYLLVGYNAGPGTAANWRATAHSIDDPLLFIESIPYAETRNYVMQVLAHYWIYQTMMDETPDSLTTLSEGKWPELRADRS